MTRAELITLRDHASAVLKIADATPDNWPAHADANVVQKDRERMLSVSLDYFLAQIPESPLKLFKDSAP